MRYTLLTCCVLLTVSACEFTDSSDRSDERLLLGSWLWVQSTGGLAGGTHKPSSETGNVWRIYRKDRSFSFYTADTLAAEGTFSLSYDESGAVISYNSETISWFETQWIEFSDPNTLVLIDRHCNDCFTSTFKRVPR